MKKSSKTKIEFDYQNRHYCLEYTENSLKKLEQRGVKFAKLDEMVFSAPELLFRGAFFANHPNESEQRIHEIYTALKRTSDESEPQYDEDGNEVDLLIQAIADMLSEAVDELTGRGEKGNVTWRVT